MNRSRRFFGAAPVLFSMLGGVVFTVILTILVTCQDAFRPYYENFSQLSNLVLLPFSLALVVLLFFLRSREKTEARSDHLWLLRGLFLAVLAVQFLVAHSCWYKMGWDVSVVYKTAEELARGIPSSHPVYYNLCPNNAPLTMLQFIPMWVAVRIGLIEPFVVLPYIDAVLLNLSAYVTVRCVQTLTKSRLVRIFALVLSIGWIALSPYILYPYTDTFSILFPVLAFYAYLRIKRPACKWFTIALLCSFGASIKPTVSITLIALIILGVCSFLAQGDFGKKARIGALIAVAAVIIGILPGKLWQDGTTAYLAGSPKPEEQLSLTHYLMLGMNGETFGGHSVADVEFSSSYPNLAERQPANLRRMWERLSGRSLLENVHFFAVKAYKAYGDGSFASHSSFLELQTPKRTDALSTFLRSFYYKRGAMMPYWQTLMQGMWLALLTLCALACFRLRHNPAVAVLALTLLGATAYQLLFEVWPRYLFLYAPFFLLLAAAALTKPFGSKQ